MRQRTARRPAAVRTVDALALLAFCAATCGCGSIRLMETIAESPSESERMYAARDLSWKLSGLRIDARYSRRAARERTLRRDALRASPACEALRASAADGNAEAARALGTLGVEEVVKLVEPWLDSPDRETRRNAFDALVEGASDGRIIRAVEVLVAKARDPGYPHRAEALRRLGKIEERAAIAMQEQGIPEKIIDAFSASLGDSDPAVRIAAAGGLREFLQERLYSVWRTSPFAKLVPVDKLLSHLDDPEPEVRRKIVSALVNCDVSETPREAAALTGDPDTEVREAALKLLSEKPRADMVPRLGRAAMSEAGSTARGYAIDALGESRDPKAVPRLIRSLRDRSDWNRRSAIFALEKLHHADALGGYAADAAMAVAGLLADEDRDVRLYARSYLRTVGAAEEFPEAEEAMRGAPSEVHGPGYEYIAVREVPLSWFGRLGAGDERITGFAADGPGRELSFVAHGICIEDCLNLARIPLVDSESGVTGSQTRIDYGYSIHGPEERRWIGDFETGWSLMRLDLDGSDRDMTGLGMFWRVGLRATVWRSLEVNLLADLHAWVGGDDHGVQLATAAGLGVGLSASWGRGY